MMALSGLFRVIIWFFLNYSAADDINIEFLVGFETEVIFLSSTDPITPIDKTTYMRNSAFTNLKVTQMMDEIVAALQEQKIEVIQYHAESAPGQVSIYNFYEILRL